VCVSLCEGVVSLSLSEGVVCVSLCLRVVSSGVYQWGGCRLCGVCLGHRP
jgi:hypothetical protein